MPGVMMFSKCIYFNIATLNRKVDKLWQEGFKRIGLSSSHAYLLFALGKEPELTQKDLCELMEFDASTVTRFVDTLVDKGLIDKEGKGRGSSIKLSLKGKHMIKRIDKTMQKLFEETEQKIGKKEFKSFINSTTLIRNSLNNERI